MSIDKSKYLVLDIETNGLTQNDDILSIALYKPDDNTLYQKYLPLERSRKVKTTNINGITKESLKNAHELTRKEVNEIIETFELDSRTILTYSEFDKKMLRHYFKRKNLRGFEHFNFYNFKKDIISSRYSEGNVTKDNLCALFGIDGVQNIHSAGNDCILEWKLFERLDGNKLFITNNKVFEMNDDYIIPISYFDSHPNLKQYVTDFPYIECESQMVKQFEFSGESIKRFPTNISGMTIEHLINSMLCVVKQDSLPFLYKNKSALKYIGALPSKIDEIPLFFKEDGVVQEIRSQDRELVKEINSVNLSLKEKILPLIQFIKHDIFKNEEILSQELVIHKDKNILSLCDLSSKNTILEIKTNYSPSVFRYREQLYFEANGRDCYLLQIDWSHMPDNFVVEILHVNVFIGESPEKKRSIESRTRNFSDKIKNENIEVVNYFDTKTKVTLKCKICEHEWDTSYYSATHNCKCPFCELKTEKTRKNEISDEEKKKMRNANYMMKVFEKSNYTITAKNYTGSKENVEAHCQKCGYIWNIRADHLLNRLYCPVCKANK